MAIQVKQTVGGLFIFNPDDRSKKEIAHIAEKLEVEPDEYLERVINAELVKDSDMLL